ncbi:TRAP-type C4-dicarboxylate transport system permease small subunit [Sporohalobacter salinus]|nr:TRAP-type C4-dicarboxylate transport system permease small subunit [Sporohalobacter salinus]
MSRYIFIWVTFLGTVLAYDNNEHIGLDFVIDMLPKQIKPIIKLVGDLLVLSVLVILLKTGITVVNVTNNTSPALGLRLGLVYSVIPLSALIMIIINLKKIKNRFNNFLSTLKTDDKVIDTEYQKDNEISTNNA